ncbi:MAG TPA: rRNA maturation RNase YbeY [Verrucomicrobiae bacterium]
MTELALLNRQRTRPVNSLLLRRVTNVLLTDLLSLERCELAIHLVAAPEMARINQQFLNHAGSTDVITFDYTAEEQLHGEIFICIDDAVKQARQFRATWQSELVRYLIHGVLHLIGYDDLTAAGRRAMKREENRLLRKLSIQFSLRHLANDGPLPAGKSRSTHRQSTIATRTACVSLSKPARATKVRS